MKPHPTKVVSLRLDLADYETLARRAERVGMTAAEFVKAVTLREITPRAGEATRKRAKYGELIKRGE